jgi:hypothetical protein
MDASPAYQLATGSAETGTMYYTMSFLQSYGQSCEAAWAGYIRPSDPKRGAYFRNQLAAIRARGGDAIVAFGGAYGSDLSLNCGSPAALAAAYETAIDYYGFTHVDFDVEGRALATRSAVARRAPALALLLSHYKALGKTITISYTIPVEVNGISESSKNLVKDAMKDNVTIHILNLMTMDFGNYYAPDPKGKMAQYAMQAVDAAVDQLKAEGYPLASNPYASLGVTPMIGINDVQDEVFEQADATALLAWAQSKGIGRIAFWAAQRDVQCRHDAPIVSDDCSGIKQQPGFFAKTFAAY